MSKSNDKAVPLGTNLLSAYKALIGRLRSQPRHYSFAKLTRSHRVVQPSSWTTRDLSRIANGAPVIMFNEREVDADRGACRLVGTGPFEKIDQTSSLYGNVEGNYYAVAYVPESILQVIAEREFYALFMRSWSLMRRLRWEFRREWT